MDFVDGDVPPFVEPEEVTTVEPGHADPTEPHCRVCGTPLVYGGRGRKPVLCDEHKGKSSTPRASSGGKATGQVQAALQVLDGVYNALAAGLMFTSPDAAQLWAAKIPALQMQNQAILSGDPDLTRRILQAGKGGGKLAFVGVHIFTLAPVMMVVRADIAARAVAKAKPKPATRPAAFVSDPIVPPFVQEQDTKGMFL